MKWVVMVAAAIVVFGLIRAVSSALGYYVGMPIYSFVTPIAISLLITRLAPARKFKSALVFLGLWSVLLLWDFLQFFSFIATRSEAGMPVFALILAAVGVVGIGVAYFAAKEMSWDE